LHNAASFSGETAIIIEGKSSMRPSRTRAAKYREAPSIDLTHNNLTDDVESMDTNIHKGKFIRVMLPKLNENIETIGPEESFQNL